VNTRDKLIVALLSVLTLAVLVIAVEVSRPRDIGCSGSANAEGFSDSAGKYNGELTLHCTVKQ
jgi:hypothetical protein